MQTGGGEVLDCDQTDAAVADDVDGEAQLSVMTAPLSAANEVALGPLMDRGFVHQSDNGLRSGSTMTRRSLAQNSQAVL